MSIEEIEGKPGKDWTREEVEYVFNWIDSNRKVDELIRFSYHYVQDYELARDIVQEKLLDIFRYIHTYDPKHYKGMESPFVNWITSIICKESCGQYKLKEKQRKKQQNYENEMLKSSSYKSLTEQFFTKSDENQEETIELIKDCMKKLSPKLEEVIRLRYIEDMTIDEMAKKVGCNENTMKVRLFRARLELKRIVKRAVKNHDLSEI
jgi:RNA polymerase sigma-70 factor (ECF subfamily)